MRVITAPEHYEPSDKDITVFLAGGITNCPNWQKQVIDTLSNDKYYYEDNLDSLVLFNPRRENFPIGDKTAAREQIQWEYNMIEKCDIFSMYFPSSDSDQPICMYELGRNILRMQMRFPSDWDDRIVIGVEDGYKRKQDVLIQTQLATNGCMWINAQTSRDECLGYHVHDIYMAFKKRLILDYNY